LFCASCFDVDVDNQYINASPDLHYGHSWLQSSDALIPRIKFHNVVMVSMCWCKWTCLLTCCINLQAYIEGPYGAPMIDVHSERYKCFLIISSGMGWTFLRSWKRQLVQDAVRGRPVKAITSVSIMRHQDKYLLPEFSGWHYGIDEMPSKDICLLVSIFPKACYTNGWHHGIRTFCAKQTAFNCSQLSDSQRVTSHSRFAHSTIL
jgi:hypothetical protein